MNTQVTKQENGATKGYLFNVIVYAYEERHADYFFNIVRPLTENYPCRVIYIRCHKDEKGEFLEMKKQSDSNNAAACNQYSFEVSQSLTYKVPFVILPKLIPDLPIYLVWGDNPISEEAILPDLQRLATRFVFDGECAENIGEFSEKMLSKISELNIDFMDVVWAKISGWREVITEAFNSPRKIEYLNQCDKIVIKYNKVANQSQRHAFLQAAYMQGWLASRLEWKYQSTRRTDLHSIVYRTPKTDIEVILQPQERPTLDQGRIFEMEFHGVDDVSHILSLAEKQSKITVYKSTPTTCDLPFSYGISDMTKELTAMKEVFYIPPSGHYKSMLDLIKQIKWE